MTYPARAGIAVAVAYLICHATTIEFGVGVVFLALLIELLLHTTRRKARP